MNDLLKLLPNEYQITHEGTDNYWRGLVEELEDSFSKFDFERISDLFFSFLKNNNLISHPSDNVAYDLYKILYKIGTKTPIFSLSIQSKAFILIHKFYKISIKTKPLFDWRPVYNFLSEVYLNDILFNIESDQNSNIKDQMYGIIRTSRFFDEKAPDEIYDFMIPKISKHGDHFLDYLLIFCILYPENAKNYKHVINFVIDMLINLTKPNEVYPICYLLYRFTANFLDDDFSNLVQPILAQYVAIDFYQNKSNYFYNNVQQYSLMNIFSSNDLTQCVANTITNLLFSPYTRSVIIKEFGILMENGKSVTHPSNAGSFNNINIALFFDELISAIKREEIRSLKKSNLKRIPSQEELEQFLIPIATNIINMTYSDDISDLLISSIIDILYICPSLNDRFYNYVTQIISINDFISIKGNAWEILACLALSMQKNPNYIDTMKQYVRIALDTFYIQNIQNSISRFLCAFFSVCPLTEENNFPSDFQPKTIIVDIFNILIDLTKQHQKKSRSFIGFSQNTVIFNLCYVVFSGASKSVIHELLPNVLSTITDVSLYACPNYFIQILSFYSLFAPKEDLEEIYEKIKKQAARNITDLDEISFIASYLAIIGRNLSESEDDSRQVLKELEKFRESDKRKVRKIGWIASISVVVSIYNFLALFDYDPKETNFGNDIKKYRSLSMINPPNNVLDKDLKFRFAEKRKYYPKLVDELCIPFINKVKEIEDPTVVYDLLKPASKAFVYLLSFKTTVNSDNFSQYPKFMQECKCLLRSNKDSSQFYDEIVNLCDYLHKKFSGNTMITLLVSMIISSTSRVNNFMLDYTQASLTDLEHRCHQKYRVCNRFFLQNDAFDLLLAFDDKRLCPIPNCIDKIMDILIDLALCDDERIFFNAVLTIETVKCHYPQYFRSRISKVLTDPNQKLTKSFIIFYIFLSSNDFDERTMKLMMRFIKEPIDFSISEIEDLLKVKLSYICSSNSIVTPEKKSIAQMLINQIDELLNETTNFNMTNEFFIIVSVLSVSRIIDEFPESIMKFMIKTTYNNNMLHSRFAMVFMSHIMQTKIVTNKEPIPLKNKLTCLDMPSYSIKEVDGSTPEDFLKIALPTPLIPDVDAYDNESQGFYAYSKEYLSLKCSSFVTNEALIASIPNIMYNILNFTLTDDTDMTAYFKESRYFYNLSRYVGPSLMPVLKETLDTLYKERIQSNLWEIVNGILLDIAEGTVSWKDEDANTFMSSIIVKHICVCVDNPDLKSALESLSISLFISLNISRLSPLVNYIISSSSISESAPKWRRTSFNILSSCIGWNTLGFVPSFGTILENFVYPIFEDCDKYNKSVIESSLNILFSYYSYITISKNSPNYNPKSPELIREMNERVINAVKRSDPKSKKMQYFISVIINSVSYLFYEQFISFIPVVIEIAPNVLSAITLSDEETAEEMCESISSIMLYFYFVPISNLGIKLIENIYHKISILPIDMQDNIICYTSEFINFSTHNCTTDVLEEFMESVRKDIEKISAPETKMELIKIYGTLLRMVGKKPEDNIDLCAILNTAFLIDQREDLTVQAFNEIEKSLTTCNRADKTIFKKTVEKFWKLHADQITNDVLKDIEKYRMLYPPSYIT